MLLKTLIFKKMTSNKNVVILHPDKGSGTVILNRDNYIQKSFDIITDTFKFKKKRRTVTTLPKKT